MLNNSQCEGLNNATVKFSIHVSGMKGFFRYFPPLLSYTKQCQQESVRILFFSDIPVVWIWGCDSKVNETQITLDLWAGDGVGTARQRLAADVACPKTGEEVAGD